MLKNLEFEKIRPSYHIFEILQSYDYDNDYAKR